MAKYEYYICSAEDESIFYKRCAALEKHIPNLQKEPLVMADLLWQPYKLDGNEINVFCDFYDGVHVQSDMPLEPYFEKN